MQIQVTRRIKRKTRNQNSFSRSFFTIEHSKHNFVTRDGEIMYTCITKMKTRTDNVRTRKTEFDAAKRQKFASREVEKKVLWKQPLQIRRFPPMRSEYSPFFDNQDADCLKTRTDNVRTRKTEFDAAKTPEICIEMREKCLMKTSIADPPVSSYAFWILSPFFDNQDADCLNTLGLSKLRTQHAFYTSLFLLCVILFFNYYFIFFYALSLSFGALFNVEKYIHGLSSHFSCEKKKRLL